MSPCFIIEYDISSWVENLTGTQAPVTRGTSGSNFPRASVVL